jgi:hypothetical protein
MLISDIQVPMISISVPADYEPIVKLYFNLKALFRLLNQRKPVLANLSSLDILAKARAFSSTTTQSSYL